MLAQGLPFAARLLPLLATDEAPPQARWERDYASGRWSYLAGLDELAHYSVIVGYYAFLKPGGSVLDVGCGEGILQSRLAPHGYRRYLGIDFAANAINEVSTRRGPASDFQVADAATFTTDQTFDVIIFNESLYYFRDPLSVVEQYRAFLASDGVFIVSMVIARNHIPIWNAISGVLEVVDETTVFNRSALGWTVKVLALRPSSGRAAVTDRQR
jgi:2-polyprenyl-3-methyl-5-hydroxy-6-metoxy-1,4-benzoquinol methylase